MHPQKLPILCTIFDQARDVLAKQQETSHLPGKKRKIQYKPVNKHLACSYIKKFELWLTFLLVGNKIITCSVQNLNQSTLASTADLDKSSVGKAMVIHAVLAANSAAIVDDRRPTASTFKQGRSSLTLTPKKKGCCSSHTLTKHVRRHSVVSYQLYEVSMYK